MDWIEREGFNLDSGFFATGGRDDDHWVVLFAGSQIDVAPFQSVQIRPYFQSAKDGGEQAQEAGLEGRYRFDLGGLAQAQVGGGLAHASMTGAMGREGKARGFLQAGFQGDVLGMAMGDLALRYDRSGSNDAFGFLAGFQVIEGDLVWRGDLAKGGATQGMNEVLEYGIGLRFQPDEHFDLTGRVLYETGPGGSWTGVRCGLQWKAERPFADFPRRLEFQIVDKVLRDGSGELHWDTVIQLGLGIFGSEKLWVGGRTLSDAPLLMQAGLDIIFLEGSRCFVILSNLGNIPFPWPEADSPIGSHWMAGLELGF
jgi:hypothetical protein